MVFLNFSFFICEMRFEYLPYAVTLRIRDYTEMSVWSTQQTVVVVMGWEDWILAILSTCG